MRSPSYFLGHSLSPLGQLNKERRGEERRKEEGMESEREQERREEERRKKREMIERKERNENSYRNLVLDMSSHFPKVFQEVWSLNIMASVHVEGCTTKAAFK